MRRLVVAALLVMSVPAFADETAPDTGAAKDASAGKHHKAHAKKQKAKAKQDTGTPSGETGTAQ